MSSGTRHAPAPAPRAGSGPRPAWFPGVGPRPREAAGGASGGANGPADPDGSDLGAPRAPGPYRALAAILLMLIGAGLALAFLLRGLIGQAREVVAPPPVDAPALLLVTLDSAPADRASGPGRALDTTPALRALGEAGARAEVLPLAPGTNGGLATLFTGLAPAEHDVRSLRRRGRAALPAACATLAERLSERGWATLAAVALPQLDAELSGLARGFDAYLEAEPDPRTGVEPAARLLARARPALEELLAREQPVLVWVHLADPRALGATDGETPDAAADAHAARFLAHHLGPLRGRSTVVDRALALGPAAALEELRDKLARRRGSAEQVAFLEALHDGHLRAMDDAVAALARLATERRTAPAVAVVGVRASTTTRRQPEPLPERPDRKGRARNVDGADGRAAAGAGGGTSGGEGPARAPAVLRGAPPAAAESLAAATDLRDVARALALAAGLPAPGPCRVADPAAGPGETPPEASPPRPAGTPPESSLEAARPDSAGIESAAARGRSARGAVAGGGWFLDVELGSAAAGDVAVRMRPRGAEEGNGTSLRLAPGEAWSFEGGDPVACELALRRVDGEPLEERAVAWGGAPLARVPVLRVAAERGDPWPADAGAPAVDVEPEEARWLRVAVAGAAAGQAAVVRVALSPPDELPGPPAVRDARGAEASGPLPCREVWELRGTTPLSFSVRKFSTHALALAVELDGAQVPAAAMRYRGRRFTRGGETVLYAPAWLPDAVPAPPPEPAVAAAAAACELRVRPWYPARSTCRGPGDFRAPAERHLELLRRLPRTE